MHVGFSMGIVSFNQICGKMHTLLDLRGNIPIFMHISDGKMHDVKALDLLIPETGAFYIMDRGYWILNAFTAGTPLVRIL